MQQRRPPPRACHFIPARAPRRARMRASTLAAAGARLPRVDAPAALRRRAVRRAGRSPRASRGVVPRASGEAESLRGPPEKSRGEGASPSDAGDAPSPAPSPTSSPAPSPSPRRREARADGGPDADASDDDDGIVAPLADGAEVFFLAAAAGLKTAQWRERSASERRSAATSVAAAAPVAPPPPTLVQGWLPDAALFFAVAFGAANRRRLPSRARDASSSRSTPRIDRSTDRFGRRPTVPDRLRNLELNQDRLGAKVDRAARDLSKTRVKLRLTRRAISDERAGERSAEDAAARLAAMERAIAQLAEELAMAQRTMAAMQDVAAKQFETLAGAVVELKRETGARAGEPAAGTTRPGMTSAASRGRVPTSAASRGRNPPPLARTRPARKPWSGPGFPGAAAIAASEAGKNDGADASDPGATRDAVGDGAGEETRVGADAGDGTGDGTGDGAGTPSASPGPAETGRETRRVERRRTLTFRVGGARARARGSPGGRGGRGAGEAGRELPPEGGFSGSFDDGDEGV